MSVPIHVITGFLGAGKTTLLNRLLRHLPSGHRPAIVVNDFGKIAVDGTLIDRGDYAMKELPSGCVCCTLRRPLTESLSAILDEQAPDSVLLETTGIAEPAQLLPVFEARVLASRVGAGNVICVVDGGRFMDYEAHFVVLPRQITQSNTVIINKLDLADADTVVAVRSRIAYLCQPAALVLESSHCDIDVTPLYETRPNYLDRADSGGVLPGHRLQSIAFESDGRFELSTLTALLEQLRPELVRAKGIVATDGGAKLIQLSLAGLDVSDWPAPIERTRIVVIGPNVEALDLPGRLAETRLPG
jgi:G3E family GTPase